MLTLELCLKKKTKTSKICCGHPFKKKVDGCGPVEEFWDAKGHQFNQTHFRHLVVIFIIKE
jgi:hypothetical protein